MFSKYDVVHLTIGDKSGYAVRCKGLFTTEYQSKRSKDVWWSDPQHVMDYCLFLNKEDALDSLRKENDLKIIVKEDPKIVKIIDGNN